jgi:hypothetical protein
MKMVAQLREVAGHRHQANSVSDAEITPRLAHFRVTDALGNVATMQYDSACRVLPSINANGFAPTTYSSNAASALETVSVLFLRSGLP